MCIRDRIGLAAQLLQAALLGLAGLLILAVGPLLLAAVIVGMLSAMAVEELTERFNKHG